jgi:hypothetical protein
MTVDMAGGFDYALAITSKEVSPMEIQPKAAPRRTDRRKPVYVDHRWRPVINLQDSPVKVNNGNDANNKNTVEDLS